MTSPSLDETYAAIEAAVAPPPSEPQAPLPPAPAKPSHVRVIAKPSQLPPFTLEPGETLDLHLATFNRTDLGNVERFAWRYRDQFIHCTVLGWLYWDGARWAKHDVENLVKTAIAETVRKIQDEAAVLKTTDRDVCMVPATDKKAAVLLSDRLLAHGLASESEPRRSAMLADAQAHPAFRILDNELDADPFCFNAQNCTLHISREDSPIGYIRAIPHNAHHYLTKISNIVYDPNATCPTYDRYLDQVQINNAEKPDKEAQRFLHQWAGYCLTGDTTEHKMTFHYGKGRNGKSVWVNCMTYVMGDYADSISIESFLNASYVRSGGQATPDIAEIPGVRFLTTSEPKKGAVMDEALVKLLTGGDRMKARHLNRGFFAFTPQAKLTMQGNYRPVIKGTDEGIWGRIVLVPWRKFIQPKDRDRTLDVKLQREASGILNRVLDGLRLWIEQGLVIPDSIAAATQEYRDDSDPLARFLDLCTRQAIGQRVQSTELYAVFCAWAKAFGETEWTQKGLTAALRDKGLASKKANNVYWLDIELIKSAMDFVDYEGRPYADRGDEA